MSAMHAHFLCTGWSHAHHGLAAGGRLAIVSHERPLLFSRIVLCAARLVCSVVPCLFQQPLQLGRVVQILAGRLEIDHNLLQMQALLSPASMPVLPQHQHRMRNMHGMLMAL